MCGGLGWQVAVIASNPDQSKHLETARMTVAGLELDLVNLRSEKYADRSSRIPTMEFGTPEEDALRWVQFALSLWQSMVLCPCRLCIIPCGTSCLACMWSIACGPGGD